MFENQSLKAHLIADNFFQYSEELYIIDDYNIFGITNEAINFFFDNFKDLRCRTIYIYFQVDFKIDSDFNNLINQLANEFNFNTNEFHSLYTLLQTNFRNIKDDKNKLINLKKSISSKSWKIYGAINFCSKMKSIGIDVFLIPFSIKKIKPPFHGRYWLAKNGSLGKGYIVDASLNTYGKGKIFAQLMDDENYQLISDFFDDLIIKTQLNVHINLSELEYFKNVLNKIRYEVANFPR